jgi:hypothetical protein
VLLPIQLQIEDKVIEDNAEENEEEPEESAVDPTLVHELAARGDDEALIALLKVSHFLISILL